MTTSISVLVIQLLIANPRIIKAQPYDPTQYGPAAEDFPDTFPFTIVDEPEKYGGLFLKDVPEMDRIITGDTGIYLRLGDAYVFNSARYLINLEVFLEKQAGTYKLPPLLTLHPSPLGGLGKTCVIPRGFYDILEDFVYGLLREEQLLPGNPDISNYDLCTPLGFIPLLTCKQGPDEDSGVCSCNLENTESRWTPYVYQQVLGLQGTAENETVLSCAGVVGSICNGVTVQCGYGLLCERDVEGGPAFCGGSLGVLARGFGGSFRYTDEQLADILRKRKFKSSKELEEYLIRISNSFDVIGKDCDPKYWSWATRALQPVLTFINATNGKKETLTAEDFSTHRLEFLIPHNAQIREYFYASVLKQAHQLDHDPSFYNREYWELEQKRAEYYDVGESCLNEYPRMTCRRKERDPVRGLCECATSLDTGSKIFNYFAEDNQCVGGLGAVCTTVRGSGDHICAKGLICESLNAGQDPNANLRIPGPLAHHEIKICKRPISGMQEEEVKETPKKKSCAVGLRHGVLTFLLLSSYIW